MTNVIGIHELGRSGENLSDVLVAIPAYNEERFIGSVVLQAKELGCPVVVVDDGSGDHTARIAEAAGAEVLVHQQNGGKSAALNTIFATARARSIRALVVLDGDGQHAVGAVPRVVKPILDGTADLVIGSRFLQASGGSTPAIRRIGQRWVTTLANASSGVSVTDSQSGFRAFSAKAIEVFSLRSEGFGAEVEMQFVAKDHALVVTEVPIRAIYADPGKRNVVGQGIEVANRVLHLTGRHRPLLWYSVAAVLLLAAGTALASVAGLAGEFTPVVQRTGTLAQVAGILAMFCGLMLHALRGFFLDIDRWMRDFMRPVELQRRRTDPARVRASDAPAERGYAS